MPLLAACAAAGLAFTLLMPKGNPWML